MPLDHILIFLVTHGIPMLLFISLGIDILLRNHRNVEHILVAGLCLSYFLMFLGELVRNLASIDYSPLISSFWFSSLGLFTLSLGFRYVMYISKLGNNLPKWLNPYIFYIPLIPIVINLFTGAKLFSTQSFEQIGMFIYPIYDFNYYATMAGSVIANCLLIIPILFVYKKATPEQQKVYKSLMIMFAILALCNLILGFVSFPDFVPPYPYLYAGIIFCFYLRKIMQDTDFLQQYDKRYEKLFSMNPDAIFLLDSSLNLRELNPVAQEFIDNHQITFNKLYDLLTPQVQSIIKNQEPVRNFEFTLKFNDSEYDLLLDVDHFTIELAPHIILILRNITALKQQQREIEFLAYHDALTKLPNRRYFFEKLPEILEDAYLDKDTITIYLLDINNLKMLNDLRGHEAGDQAIQMLASILRNLVNEFGIVARIGGDEFIVSFNETKSACTPEQFICLVKTEFTNQIAIFKDIPVGTSIGYSHYPKDSKNIDTLFTMADQSMYEMKKLKKVQYR